MEPRKGGKASGTDENFHDWKVLGKVAIKEAAARKKLVDALRLGAEDNAGIVAACFIPRHGLRLKSGKETVDLVICFQCLSIQVYINGNMAKGFLTSGDPQSEFDAALTAAGIQLAKRAASKEGRTVHSGESFFDGSILNRFGRSILPTPETVAVHPAHSH